MCYNHSNEILKGVVMRKTTSEKNARVKMKMEPKCNFLGFLVSNSEMSKFTPNLYDNIFIFTAKTKEDAISERAKYKQNMIIEEEIAPEVIEEIIEQEPIYETEVIEQEPELEPEEETIIEEPIEEIVEEEIVAPEVVEEIVQPEVIEEINEPIVEAESVPFIPVVVAPVQEEEIVVELEPLPCVILEPIPVIELAPIPVVDLEATPQVVEEQVYEPAEYVEYQEPVEEIVEEQVVEEPVEIIEEEPIPEEPIVVEEEYIAEPFMAIMIPSSTEEDAGLLKERYKTVPLEKRLERAPESVRHYYSEIKNELLSYESVKSRMSKKFDTFSIGRFTVAKLTCKNDVVKLYLALANDTIDTKYYTEDVSSSEIYDQTPTLHNVKSKRGLKYGIELIREIMSSIGYSKVDGYIPVDFAIEFAPIPVSTKKQYIADLMTKECSVDKCNVITNELAYDMLNIVKSDEYTINKFYPVNKFRIYTDDLIHWFEDGDVVTIAKLQEKGALPVMENLFLEVHGRGVLDRRLFVEAHSYDMEAIKMILLTDGEANQYK